MVGNHTNSIFTPVYPSFVSLPPASEGWGKVIFSLCVSVNTSTGGGGTPSQVWIGGTPSQVWTGMGVPNHRSGWGVPRPRSGLGGEVFHPRSGQGGTPSQVWMGGVPWGTPIQVWIVGVTPSPTPIRQSSIASTWYPAGGMPLAFTQEDFLVFVQVCTSRILHSGEGSSV